ncbi:MAG: dihydrofolate reductase family protein [Paludibacter sp.]
MSKVILYIASSIDGFIARENGSLDWLDNLPNPDSIDHGYNELLADIDTIIMGRKTYEVLLGFGFDWPYLNKKTYIVSRNTELIISTPNTFLVNDELSAFTHQIKLSNSKNCWLVGGGELVHFYLNNNLVDKIIISIAPVILGVGIPLFVGKSTESKWTLVDVEKFNTGIVNLTYNKN